MEESKGAQRWEMRGNRGLECGYGSGEREKEKREKGNVEKQSNSRDQEEGPAERQPGEKEGKQVE